MGAASRLRNQREIAAAKLAVATQRLLIMLDNQFVYDSEATRQQKARVQLAIDDYRDCDRAVIARLSRSIL